MYKREEQVRPRSQSPEFTPALPKLFRRSPTGTRQGAALRAATVQTLAFSAAAGNALTIFLAGFALTITTLPKTSRFPALVAGFMRVLILHKPGSAKMPVFTTSLVAISDSEPMNLAATDFLSSHAVASASAIAPLVMALAVF